MINRIITVFVLFVACSSLTASKSKKFHNIIRIEVIMLPETMTTVSDINSETEFDHDYEILKDTALIEPTFSSINIGKKSQHLKSIDIRTKVILYFKHNKTKKIFLDDSGKVLYQDDIYEGSIELLKLLRKNCWRCG